MSNIRAKMGWLRRRPHQLLSDFKNIKEIKDKNKSGQYIYYFGVPEHFKSRRSCSVLLYQKVF